MIDILSRKSEQFHDNSRPILIGEVLYDRFPDGKEILGGAPFNVAWNLRGFNQNPIFVSAVGHDEAAVEIRRRMTEHGMDDVGLQSNDYPTGNVKISFCDGEPIYQIEPDQAWDFLKAQNLNLNQANVSDDVPIIYHGSLIWRNPVSRAAVRNLRSKTDATVFVDLNIRLPWFEIDEVAEILGNVDSLKLNVDELASLTGLEITAEKSIAIAAAKVLTKFSLGSLWVTAGADGAYYFDDQERSDFVAAPKIQRLVDTVGAGDAFASAVINGMLKSHEPKLILANAVKFAAKVCGLQGATTADKDFYRLS